MPSPAIYFPGLPASVRQKGSFQLLLFQQFSTLRAVFLRGKQDNLSNSRPWSMITFFTVNGAEWKKEDRKAQTGTFFST
ncbi:hypothetical protein CXU19_13135 [Akkermansia muciniphila]|nr:hypothetical protein CXU19_13135 [Akkermansia muciniphila]PNC40189.1 hypothetical protein CXU20_02315 [Akkermansia muciniphila]